MKCPECEEIFRSKKKYLLHLQECREGIESELGDCEYRLNIIEAEIEKAGGQP